METGRECRFGFHKLSEKDVKSLKIMELISRKGIISRTEISKTTGINVVSISNYINKYIQDKLVMEKGFDVSTGGRKPELVELNKDDNRVIGIDAGKDSIRIVLADIALDIITKTNLPKSGTRAKDMIKAVCDSIEELIKKTAIAPGGIKAAGVATSLESGSDISKAIKEKFGVETFIGDEPSCAAFGEKMANKNIPQGDMLYIYSDIGYGVVVKEDGNRIACGESKYLSPWKSSLDAISLARADVARGVGTSIVEIAKGKMENIDENVVIEAARGGDEVAVSIMRSVGMGLGLRIAYLINLFNPKSVVIGGGIEKAGNLVLEPIKKTVGKMSLKDYSGAVVIMPGILGEEAVSLGAASLAAREIFLKG